MKDKKPRWIIPLEPGQVTEDGPRLVVSIVDVYRVIIRLEQGAYQTGFLPTLGAVAACQLGQALLDAAKWVGRERARRAR